MTEPHPHDWHLGGPRSAPPFPVVPAGHDSECPECGELIEVGDMITLEPRWHGETWIHEECSGFGAGVED